MYFYVLLLEIDWTRKLSNIEGNLQSRVYIQMQNSDFEMFISSQLLIVLLMILRNITLLINIDHCVYLFNK